MILPLNLFETSVLSVLCGMCIGAVGWSALPFLASLLAVEFACTRQRNLGVGGARLKPMLLWICVAVTGAVAGVSRTQHITRPAPRDPASHLVMGHLPGSGKSPRESHILWSEVLDNPTPTYRGWRVRVLAAGEEATLYGVLPEEIPLRGDALIARCKARPRRASPTPSPSLRCERVSPGISAQGPRGFMEWLTWARFRVIRGFLNEAPSDASRAAAALSTGAKNLLSPVRRDQLARLGLLHLWAVSGLHILLLAGAASMLLRRIWGRIFPGRARPAPRVLGALSALPIVLTYAVFVGGSPSALRATAAFAIFTLLQFSRRPATGRQLWVLTCALELSCATTTLTSAGALLSHAASAGILFLFGGVHIQSLQSEKGWKRNIAATFRAGIAATVATAPLSIAFFGSVAPLGILLGLLWVPLISLIILPLCLLSSLAICSGAPEILSQHFVGATTALMSAANASLDTLDAPGMRISLAPDWCAVVAPLAVFALAAWSGELMAKKEKKRFRWALAFLVPLLFAGASLKTSLQPAGTLVTALSIGHGDAFLVRLSTGEVILIDAGPGQPDGTRSALSPERLRHLGVSRIDLLVITHRHADHFGGAFRLIPDIPIGRCIIPQTSWRPKSREWHALTSTLESAGLTCQPVAAGGRIKGRGFSLDILFPFQSPADSSDEAAEDENASSIIAHLQTEDGRIWITGDSPMSNEKQVMGTIPTHVSGGILLVPHHGSTSSSSFALLERTNPHVAVVSHGKNIPSATEKKYRNLAIPLCGTHPEGSVQLRLLSGFTLLPLKCLWE